MTINISPWRISPPRLSSVQNEAPGLSEIVRRISGNAATLIGHTTGADRVVDIGNPAPLNPSGEYGHDHSGGDFGRALLRSITTLGFGHYNEWQSPSVFATDTAVLNFAFPSAAGGVTSIIDSGVVLPFWVPPCQPGGAYDNLGISCVARVSAGTANAADSATIRFANAHPGTFVSDELTSQPTATLTMSAVNAVVNTHLESGASTRLRALPGAVNLLSIRVSLIRAAGGASRGATIHLVELELGVYVT